MGICRIQKPTSAKISHGKLFAQIICNGVEGEEYDFDAIKGDLRLHLICEEEESATFYFGKENNNDTKIMELENKINNLETMINTILSGSECNCKKDDGEEINSRQGLYIADGAIGGYTGAITIYENDNGNIGASVDSIAKDDWLKLQHYAPEIEIALTSVFAAWTGEGVPLNFAKLKRTGNGFGQNNREFNQEIKFPLLEYAGNQYFMINNDAFNQDLDFPMLNQDEFNNLISNCRAINNKKISFGKLILSSNHKGLFASNTNPNILEIYFFQKKKKLELSFFLFIFVIISFAINENEYAIKKYK